jgi:hypothetical protein
MEMPAGWKTAENQTQVSRRFPPSLEIAARFPHSHSPGDWLLLFHQTKPKRKEAWRRSFAPAFRLIVVLENAVSAVREIGVAAHHWQKQTGKNTS